MRAINEHRSRRRARLCSRLCVGFALAAAVPACAARTTETTTWTAQGNWARPGRVESVTQIVQRTEGNPGAGAAAGALIGAVLLGHHGHPSLFGALAGGAVGAAASSSSVEVRTYQVLVRFDDGEAGVFLFRDYAPFAAGEYVVLTPSGLAHR